MKRPSLLQDFKVKTLIFELPSKHNLLLQEACVILNTQTACLVITNYHDSFIDVYNSRSFKILKFKNVY